MSSISTPLTQAEKTPATLLLIEDDQSIQSAILLMLQGMFTIIFAGTMKEARTVIDKNKSLDIILMDVTLPNGSGLDLLSEVAGLCPEVPIVVISGNDYQIGEVVSRGAHDFLHKPFHADELKNSLMRARIFHRSWRFIKPIKQAISALKNDMTASVENLKKHEEAFKELLKTPSDKVKLNKNN